jgi:aminoglycoside 6'-N-acetyltransferase I
MRSGPVALVVAGPGDAALFDRVAEDVFDGPLRADLLAEFLADPRHHIVVAHVGGTVVGMVTGVHYIHPDKPAQLWIKELGVAPTHRRRGIATALMGALLGHARRLGCTEAWVVADPTEAAVAFYRSLDADQTGTHLAMFSFDLGAEAA